MNKILWLCLFLISFTTATALYSTAQQETVNDTLVRVRATYPALVTKAQAAAILNETAWVHRAEGYALLGKTGGNTCPTPAGVLVSCDFLINTNTKHGWDVLRDSPDDSGPKPAAPGSVVGDGEDLTGAIASGSRSVVLPVDPGGASKPPISDSELAALAADLAALHRKVAGDIAAITADLAELHRTDAESLNEIRAALGAAVADVQLIKAKGVPTECRASINLGATRIPISCSLR